jgi:hypothetical protein
VDKESRGRGWRRKHGARAADEGEKRGGRGATATGQRPFKPSSGGGGRDGGVLHAAVRDVGVGGVLERCYQPVAARE